MAKRSVFSNSKSAQDSDSRADRAGSGAQAVASVPGSAADAGRAELVGAEMSPPQRTMPALVMSLTLHVVILMTVAWLWTPLPNGTGEEMDRPIGIAIVHRLPDRDRFVEATQREVMVDSTAEAATSAEAAAAAPPAEVAPPIDLAGLLESMQAAPKPVAGTGLAGETDLDGDAFDLSPGRRRTTGEAATEAMLFGISGSGTRFVYVFDRSDSMNGFSGRPLRAAKAELMRSLSSMTPRQQFQIIFYNDKPTPFRLAGLPLDMVPGEPEYVEQARNYIRSIQAFGGTEHESALKMALRLGPDVIFFLTDARIPRLSVSELRDIRIRAQRNGTTIHAIEFGPVSVPPRESFLRDLAQQNNGEYRYVNVRSFKRTTIESNATSESSNAGSTGSTP